LATHDCYSQKATMGRELMAPRTDRTTRIPSGVASPVTTNHAAKGSVFVNLRNDGNLKMQVESSEDRRKQAVFNLNSSGRYYDFKERVKPQSQTPNILEW